jgi:hypothetical protein
VANTKIRAKTQRRTKLAKVNLGTAIDLSPLAARSFRPDALCQNSGQEPG